MVDFLNATFTGTNNTFITDHNANWSEMEWGTSQTDTANRPVLWDNTFQAANINDESRSVRWDVDPGADEYDVDVDWSFRVGPQSGRHHAVYVRMSPTGTAHSAVDYYRIRGSSSSDTIEIAKNVGGVFTGLTSVGYTFSIDAVHHLRIEVRTTGITVFINDVQMTSTADTAITQRGRVGIGTRRGDTTSAHWQDNLVGAIAVDRPVAEATTPTPTVSSGTVGVQLNGAASVGAGAPYTFEWRQISGTAVTLSSTTAQNPTFTAPATSATLVFGLIVTDVALVESVEDTVTVTVVGAENTAIPVTDIDVVGWTAEPISAPTLASTIDDTDNATYIISPANPVAAQAEFGLTALNTPQAGDTVRMNYRARFVDGTSGSVTVYLMQGGVTQIATRVHTITEEAGLFEPFEDILTEGEIAAITVPTDLSVIIEVTSS